MNRLTTTAQVALAGRWRRWFLLAYAGVPVAIHYLLVTAVEPFLARPHVHDFQMVYGAARTLPGGDPYQVFFRLGSPGYNYSLSYYIYPPLQAWLVQPLTHLGDAVAGLVVLVLLQTCVVAFLVVVFAALRVRDRQAVAAGTILTLGFAPLYFNLFNYQSNVILLTLSAIVLLAYVRGDRLWGGLALGFGLALKPLQAGTGLLLIWGRRPRMVAGAMLAGLLSAAVAVPSLWPEYVLRVLPSISSGTGWRDNAAPAGLAERLLDPSSFYSGATSGGWVVRGVAIAVGLTVVLVTWRVLAAPRRDEAGRSLEMAAAGAAAPLLTTLADSFHLLLLLLPILVVMGWAWRTGDGWSLAGAAAAWLLISPVHAAVFGAIAGGFTNDTVLRIWGETQTLAPVILWLTCLRALRRTRAGAKPPVPDELAKKPAARREVIGRALSPP